MDATRRIRVVTETNMAQSHARPRAPSPPGCPARPPDQPQARQHAHGTAVTSNLTYALENACALCGPCFLASDIYRPSEIGATAQMNYSRVAKRCHLALRTCSALR